MLSPLNVFLIGIFFESADRCDRVRPEGGDTATQSMQVSDDADPIRSSLTEP